MLSFERTQSLTEAGMSHVFIDDVDISFGEISAETFFGNFLTRLPFYNRDKKSSLQIPESSACK